MVTFPSSSQTTTQSNLNWLQMEEPSVDFAGFRITFLLKYLSSGFSLDFPSPQPWHGDAAALLPAGAPGGHHGADRQHLGWEPLQVLAVTLLGTPAMIYHLLIRCTGYRPILDAFKKFGSDAPGAKERVAALVADIEDLGLGGDSGICKRTGKVKTIPIQDCQSCQGANPDVGNPDIHLQFQWCTL